MRHFHGSVLCLSILIGTLSSPFELSRSDLNHVVKTLGTDRMQEPEASVKDIWLRYQKINRDLKAVLVFENGLLSLPVVQTENNTAYLRKSIDGTYSSMGTPFLDCHDSMHQKAFLIYGHNVFSQPSQMFSPLLQLETQDGYERNRRFCLFTETDVIYYEIISVFRMKVHPSEFDQRKSVFIDRKDFDEWIAYPLEHNEIHAEETVSYEDSLCLLQTCVRENKNERLIVLAKRESR